MITRALVLLVWASLVPVSPAQCHPGHEAEVDHLTREFADHPGRTDLLRLRGEIHHRNGAHGKALTDLLAALALDPGSPETRLCLAALRLDLGDPAAAMAELDSVDERHRTSAAYFDLLSRITETQGHTGKALGHLDRALALRSSRPRDWLRRTELCLAMENPDEALQGLRRGCKELATPWILIERAASLEADRDRPEAALLWLEQAPQAVRESHIYWSHRGDLLRVAGRNLEALAAWTTALEHIDDLPANRRATTDALSAATDLREKLHAR